MTVNNGDEYGKLRLYIMYIRSVILLLQKCIELVLLDTHSFLRLWNHGFVTGFMEGKGKILNDEVENSNVNLVPH